MFPKDLLTLGADDLDNLEWACISDCCYEADGLKKRKTFYVYLGRELFKVISQVECRGSTPVYIGANRDKALKAYNELGEGN